MPMRLQPRRQNAYSIAILQTQWSHVLMGPSQFVFRWSRVRARDWMCNATTQGDPGKEGPQLTARDLLILKLCKYFWRRGLEILCQASTDNENVAVLKLDTLILGYRFNFLHCDTMAIERMDDSIITCLALGSCRFLCPFLEIDQNTSSNQSASSVPVIKCWCSVSGRISYFQPFLRHLDAVICEARGLVLPVHQTVPLTAELRVEVDLVVPTCAFR